MLDYYEKTAPQALAEEELEIEAEEHYYAELLKDYYEQKYQL